MKPITNWEFIAIFLWLLAMPFSSPGAEVSDVVDRSDWKAFFDEADVEGTIIVVDQRNDGASTLVYNLERSTRPYSPASTYKIPHSIFALDAGVVADEFEIIEWDGEKRAIPAWNCDQTLGSAMSHSVVWVYERFAAKIGDEKECLYMEQIDYGNSATTGKDPFWVGGDLMISAQGQIHFLRTLYENNLPFQEIHQRLVKDLMIIEAGSDWILRAKTGWNGQVGWWIGWVESPAGPVFFALNIDTPRRLKNLPSREGISRAILRSLKALPQ